MSPIEIAIVLVVILVWTGFCFRTELKQFFVSGQRTNSTGPGGGSPYHRAAAIDSSDRFIANVGGSTENLAKCIESIDEKDLKQLILKRIRAREITHDQYSFFLNQITTDHLNLLTARCSDELTKQEVREKLAKLQWISRESS